MKYKAVLLDIDDTLYDYHFAHQAALNSLKESFYNNFKISGEKFKELYSASRAFFNNSLKGTASSHNRLLYIQKMLELSKLDVFKYSLELHDLYWTTFIKNIKLFKGLV
jgi:putative hydrolase of the HAD superfamily